MQTIKFLFGIVLVLICLQVAPENGRVSVQAGDFVPEPTPPEPIGYINPEIPDVPAPIYEGDRYEALVPATFDLAERARLALHAMTEGLNPHCDFEAYWLVDLLGDPPWMFHDYSSHVRVKYMQVYPLMRAMSGSEQNLDREHRVTQIYLQMQGPDGLIYTPFKGRPWGRLRGPNEGVGTTETPKSDQFAGLTWDNGRMLGAFTLYGLRDPKGPFAEAAKRLAEGLKKVIIVEDDIAYLFNNSTEPGTPIVKPKERPKKYVMATQSMTAHGLAQYSRLLSGDPEAADLAHRIMRNIMRDAEYYGPNGEYLTDYEGKDGIHFHTHTMVILVALEVAEMTGDKELVEMALQRFDWGQTAGGKSHPLVGYFPEFLDFPYATSETCEVADMIMAGILLSKLGHDRWDSVDRWIRNQYAENQLMRVDWVKDGHLQTYDRSKQQKNMTYTTLDVADRCLGSFAGWPTANDWQYKGRDISIMHCCTVNGSKALYYIWRNMISHEEGAPGQPDKLRVHLLYNRASEWTDIDSHIPYVGRVDVRPKQDLQLEIRIPEWAEPENTSCDIGGDVRDLTFSGRYAMVGDVKKGDSVTLNFPITERTEKVHIQGEDYTLVLRGNSVVSIDPPGKIHPLYQRGHYRSGETLWQKVTRFVPDDELDW